MYEKVASTYASEDGSLEAQVIEVIKIEKAYEVRMYRDGKLVDKRYSSGKSELYHENIAENYVTGVLSLES